MEPLLCRQGRKFVLKVHKYVIIMSANTRSKKEKSKRGSQKPPEDAIFCGSMNCPLSFIASIPLKL